MENQAADATAAAVTAAPAAATDNPYGFEALINHGTGISYAVLAILAIMSLTSYYVFITKFYDQWKLGKAARRVEKQFWTAASPKEGAERLPKDDDFRVVAESALRAATHHEGRLNDRISLNDWLAMALQRSVDALRSRLSTGLSWLATVGSTAPFVGLFGTVAGIIHAFQGMALTGSGGLGAVSAGIAEALVTTAFGLFVAIPAVWLYNYFLQKVDRFQVEMSNSSSQLIDYFIKNEARARARV